MTQKTRWETVIGLEVHAELATRSKIFCACTTAFGDRPNTHVCPVCAGMPGTLPVLNRAVVDCALRTALALQCTVTRHGKFDRKHYFYPDLPKAYQVSQLYAPIGRDGRVDIDTKIIGIHQIHMEEDAGKLVHDAAGHTQMDYNRCGVPLLEIVSKPDFRDADEVRRYLEQLRETLLFLGVCDGKMQEGSLRVDVNLSVRPAHTDTLGTRTETKNLNSFKAITRAIAYESARQIEILERGDTVEQETRRWDDDRGVSFGMRSKENAHDYRYFPEPDLLPLVIDDEWLNTVRADLPETPRQKRARYAVLDITEADAAILTTHPHLSALFESVAEQSGAPVEAAHLITGPIMQLMNQTNTPPEALSPAENAPDAAKLAALIRLMLSEKINRNAYKTTVEAVFLHDVDPEDYIRQHGLTMHTDTNAIADAVRAALAENPDTVTEYRAGKNKAFAFLMGQALKKLGGSGNPGAVKAHLTEAIASSE